MISEARVTELLNEARKAGYQFGAIPFRSYSRKKFLYRCKDREGNDCIAKMGTEIHIIEENILRRINDLMMPRFPKVIDIFIKEYDTLPMRVSLIIMEEFEGLHPDEIDFEEPSEFMNIIDELIIAVRELHSIGYIHGDIKPGNILVQCYDEDVANVCLIDFDMSKDIKEEMSKRLTKNKREIIPKRKYSRFHGTLEFCSISQHCRSFLQEYDDLESILFTVIFIIDTLPWDKNSRSFHHDINQNTKYISNIAHEKNNLFYGDNRECRFSKELIDVADFITKSRDKNFIDYFKFSILIGKYIQESMESK